jgi:hypothetical protein
LNEESYHSCVKQILEIKETNSSLEADLESNYQTALSEKMQEVEMVLK